ncbi:MAG: DUF4062 domain-containing protein [Caldilineaceae bacterium]|nr:DUF4062 domain-containing protein [Caldilineaceae bacterium]
MATFKVFLSSVQSEFANERASLREYFQTDPLLSETFEILLFEDIPPSEVPPDTAYLERVDQADILIGLFGLEYGIEGGNGISPTEKEYNRASDTNTHRLVFVKEAEDEHRHPKMRQLIGKAQQSLVVGQFNTIEDLRSGIQTAMVDYMKVKRLIQTGGFDEAICQDAKLKDISEQAVVTFVRSARRARQLPLGEETPVEDVLTHLRLIKDNGVTNAAVQLFGKNPQRLGIRSEVRCAHFHGTEIEKPIPSLQVFGGTLFSQVDSAEDFVLSKINMSVGTRAESVRAPRTYEIPVEVIREAIVNAVVHRDFTSTGNVQVMIFADRLEIWNPGRLPPSLTIEKLREPHGSVPSNPLLAESMFLAEYIERMGTGTLDMIRRCRDAGLPEPEFRVDDMFKVTIHRVLTRERILRSRPRRRILGRMPSPRSERIRARDIRLYQPNVSASGSNDGQNAAPQVPDKYPASTLQVGNLIRCLDGERTRAEILQRLGLRDRSNLTKEYLRPAIAEGLVEMTIPDKPRSSKQRYRLTSSGRELQERLRRAE